MAIKRKMSCLLFLLVLDSYTLVYESKTSTKIAELSICMMVSIRIVSRLNELRMNDAIWLTCDKNQLKASLVLHMRQLKKITKNLKQNAGRWEVREGSPVEVQWAVRWVGEDLWWKGFVDLSLEWKREEVMDGVMVVTDDERGWRNEAGRLFQRLGVRGVAYRNERSVILSEEDDGGRVMVMSDDERVRPGGWTEIRLWR